MTIYIFEDNAVMYHNEENCREEIEQYFLDNELMEFLSDYAEDVRHAITCLAYGGTEKDSDVQNLCSVYLQELEDYINLYMHVEEVEEEDLDFYEKKYDWGD